MHEKRVQDELRRRQTKQLKGRIGGRGHNPEMGIIDVVNQADAVPEEHLYIVSGTPNGSGCLWQADMLGDRVEGSYGKLPPVIQIYCPFCGTVQDPRPINITWTNKKFQIEDRRLNPILVPGVKLFDGQVGDFEIEFVLTVLDTIKCPYDTAADKPMCGVRFTIVDAHIERA